MKKQFAGTLSSIDQKTHITHEFVLETSAAEISITLTSTSTPKTEYPTMLCLSLFDPDGFRGSGHRAGATHALALTTDSATRGYLQGALPAGNWAVVIHVHRVMEPAICTYTLDVVTVNQTTSIESPSFAKTGGVSGPPRPGWYRGDLHAHTRHSDAGWDMSSLLAMGDELGLDFMTVTDHNTIAHLREVEELPDQGFLVMGGMELTTFHGHALSLGTREWIDWGVLEPSRSMQSVADEVAARGGLFVIAHPMADGDPRCTGCDWRFEDMRPGNAPAVEIWNGRWDSNGNNERALELWYSWLNEGYRLVATAGTDAHGPKSYQGNVGFSVVWAEDRTEKSILEAIGRGHLFLSAGPRVELTARSEDRQFVMGDVLNGAAAEVNAGWDTCPAGSTLRLIGDGEPVAEIPAAGGGQRSWTDLSGRWHCVEIRADDGQLLAITNPIFS